MPGIAVLPMWSILTAGGPSAARRSAMRAAARFGERGSYREITTGVADIATDCPLWSSYANVGYGQPRSMTPGP